MSELMSDNTINDWCLSADIGDSKYYITKKNNKLTYWVNKFINNELQSTKTNRSK